MVLFCILVVSLFFVSSPNQSYFFFEHTLVFLKRISLLKNQQMSFGKGNYPFLQLKVLRMSII